jgi:glycosyltransferase involved in cell wall biosynthesis
MTEAVAARQGDVYRLDQTSPTLIKRAEALRQLAATFDVVVLHIHPDDVTPLLAFARRAESPRVMFVNHADHVFWLGVTLPDVFINYRLTGQRLGVRRRGLSEGQMTVLPIPIDSRKQRVDRGEARRELGLDNRLVILTIGTAYKYEPLNGKGFLDYMAPILADHPEAALLAVGPDPTGRWLLEENRSKGQIRAMGRRSDLPKLFAASDIYMDSSPFGSVTATLEAGIHSLPVLEFHPLPAGSEILGSDSPGLIPMVVTHSERDLAVELGALLRDSQLRNRIGQEMRAAIDAAHTNGGWQATLEAIYRLRPQRTAPRPPDTSVEALDYLTAELQSAVVGRVGVGGRIALAAKQMPGFWFLRHLWGLPSAAERSLLLRLLPVILRTNIR